MNNRYGLDDQYFEKWIDRVRRGGFSNWTPSELARELARMSKAADPKVMHEPEFSLKNEDFTLHTEILSIMRKKSEMPHTYINPNFLMSITEAIEGYYEVEDDVVNDWIKGMFEC